MPKIFYASRWLPLVLACVSVAAAAIAVPASAAYADGVWREIRSRWSWKCIDMQDGTDLGSLAQQRDCNGSQDQQFAPLDTGDGYFLLQNQRSGRCLRPTDNATNSGVLIELWNCHSWDPGQQWQAVDPGGNSTGAKWLINRNSSRCLEDTDWQTDNGAPLTQQDCVMGWKDYWFGL